MERRRRAAALEGRKRRLARTMQVLGGALLAVIGVFLALHPFASLAVLVIGLAVGFVVLGVLSAVSSSSSRLLRVTRLVAAIAGAFLVLAWPGATITAVAVVAGIYLVADGVLDVVGARHERGLARTASLLGGAATVVLGGLALAWPDVSVLVVAFLVGARLVLVGARFAVAGVRGDRSIGAAADAVSDAVPDARGGGWRLLATAAGAFAVAVLLVVSVALHRAEPQPDAFYDAPAAVQSEPGRLLRHEPVSRDVPDGAQGWRILYTTTRDDGVPAVASALVIVPAGGTTRPVVAWAHGTTGVVPGCAPSVLNDGLSSGAMYVGDRVLEHGWALVATDYVGLGTEGPHPYLIGQGEGRSVLDSVRAARELPAADLSDRTVVWGHSQGGHAALWTGMLAPSYAPEVPLDGVAALAPASNLPGMIESLGEVTAGQLFGAYAARSYSEAYDDVAFDDVVRPGARLVAREMAARCLAEKSALVSLLQALFVGDPIWRDDPTTGALGARLEENVPRGPIAAPLLLAQGEDDAIVETAAQNTYVDERCAAGGVVDYRTYAGRNHIPLVEADSPAIADLFAWTADRFARSPAADDCVTTRR